MIHPKRQRAAMLLLPFLAWAQAGSAADTYQGGGVLKVPTLGIGSATFSDVSLAVNLPLVRSPAGSVPVGTQDTYDPASNLLAVPAVAVGSATYYNAAVTVNHLISIGSVSGADTFDGSNLLVRNVQVVIGSQVVNAFHDVTLHVGLADVQSVGSGLPRVSVDQYVIDPATGVGVLTIGAVQVGTKVYTNVVVQPPHETASIAGYQETVLHTFQGGADGANLQAGLITDSSGNLYGTTSGQGGAGDYGTVFRLSPDGHGSYTESVLYRFQGGADSGNPEGALTLDASGNLYGTTAGVSDPGTVFRLSPDGSGGYAKAILHQFQGGAEGAAPFASVLMDAGGNLFGTTYRGGTGCGTQGCGTAFKLTPNGGGGYTESVIHAFQGGTDGAECYANLIMDADGNLYGTTFGQDVASDFGTVFRLSANGSGGYTETVLYRFQGGADGASPEIGLSLDAGGNLYGTASGGGTGSGYGTVFRLTPDGAGNYTETVLYAFKGGADGSYPLSTPLLDAGGNLYGTTSGGDVASDNGTVFKLTPSGSGGYTETLPHTFTGGADGAGSYSTLIADASGNLFGTTTSGGSTGFGVVFEVH
jgi:uncharacterized repeat protein (TIGR03803 family)